MQMKSVFLHERNQDLTCIFVAITYDTTSLQHLSVFIQQSSASTTVSTISVWINSSQSTLLIYLSITTSINQSFVPPSYPYQSQMNHQTSSVPQIAYQSPQVSTQPMTESPLVDSGFAVPVFSPGDDPIACLNKAMAFLTTVASSRFPSTNNQLRTSSNPRNQATIQDGRVTVQQVQGRQGQSYSGTGYKSNATSSGGNNASGQERTVIPNNAAFQTKDLDTYDSDCDDISNAQAVLMRNISNYGSDVISEIRERPYCKNYGYGDYQLGNVTISRVYYVEGLGHNWYFVESIFDADLEVAFRKKTCFIQNLALKHCFPHSSAERCFVDSKTKLLVEAALYNNKTPYDIMQDKKPDLSFFHVFGAHCYPTNDNDDLGKLDAKADIEAAAPRDVDLAEYPVSTSIDQNALSTSTPSTQEQEHSPNISQAKAEVEHFQYECPTYAHYFCKAEFKENEEMLLFPTTLQEWQIEPPVNHVIDRLENYFDKIKGDLDTLDRTKDEDVKKFKSQKIHFDFSILIIIKELMVDVSSKCMEMALKENGFKSRVVSCFLATEVYCRAILI
ncbi:retrovirus-related pol polyprotein from transposon TNT 1-94 [Tanacetum coccineum]|uniref:Retrovirus-related pol polyprotein from transposon TNT 1-94 n=1 Tax=Tanacetum coccineum TaxID=301880 RepID=A0ABQ5I839_9ASTR